MLLPCVLRASTTIRLQSCYNGARPERALQANRPLRSPSRQGPRHTKMLWPTLFAAYLRQQHPLASFTDDS